MAKESQNVPVKHEEARGGLWESSWEPFTHLRAEMDRLFDEFTSGWPWGRSRHRHHGVMEPFGGMMDPFRAMPFGWGAGVAAVDVVDKDEAVQVRAELPGLNEDDVDVRLSDGVLTIKGEKKEEREEGKKESSYYLSERRYGSFQRSFRIPEGIDMDNVDASFKKGVLTVTLPKSEEAQKKVKKIAVKGEK